MQGARGKQRQTELWFAVLGVAFVVLGIVWWVGARTSVSSSELRVAGNVRRESHRVTAPAVSLPVPDYAIGIPSRDAGSGMEGGVAPAPTRTGNVPVAQSALPVVAGTLTRVYVTQGDRVVAGQPLAQIDTTMLDLAVEAAKADQRRARADVGVVESTLSDVRGDRADLNSARAKLPSAEAKLVKARRDLRAARAKLVSTRDKAHAARSAVSRQIAALEAQLSRPSQPSPPATPTPQPGPTPAQLIATLKAKLAQLDAGIARMDAGIARIDKGLAKVAAGFGELASARRKLNTGASALADAQDQLEAAVDVLGVVADTRSVGVKLAEVARDAATITAPVGGTVTSARIQGTVAVVGAPIVRIAPDVRPRIDTYLTAEQVGRVRQGAHARVQLDSFPGRTFSARITRIGGTYGFVPTSFPTDLIHLTRAVKVTATLDESATLPPGTPVDLAIQTQAGR
jgi:HlyD family secretion protein